MEKWNQKLKIFKILKIYPKKNLRWHQEKVLPVIGSLLYWNIRKNFRKKSEKRQENRVLMKIEKLRKKRRRRRRKRAQKGRIDKK